MVWQYSTSMNGNERKSFPKKLERDYNSDTNVLSQNSNPIPYTNQGMGEWWCGWIWILHLEWLWARKKKCWLQDSILIPCQGHDCLGKEVKYASDMVLKHSQKGDSDLQRLATIETPLIGWVHVGPLQGHVYHLQYF